MVTRVRHVGWKGEQADTDQTHLHMAFANTAQNTRVNSSSIPGSGKWHTFLHSVMASLHYGYDHGQLTVGSNQSIHIERYSSAVHIAVNTYII